jgi:hypothetical protein
VNAPALSLRRCILLLLSGTRNAARAPHYAPYQEASCDQSSCDQCQEGPPAAGIGQALGYRSGEILLHRVTNVAYRARKGGG